MITSSEISIRILHGYQNKKEEGSSTKMFDGLTDFPVRPLASFQKLAVINNWLMTYQL